MLDDNNINKPLIEKIDKVEKDNNESFSSTQKILLTTDGSITAILDVLKGKIDLKTLNQHYTEADKEISELLDVNIGDKVIYREILMYKYDEPLIYALSYIPVERLSKGFEEDLMREDIPLGRILRKYNIESRREVKNINLEKTNKTLIKIYNTEEDVLSRSYNIIKDNEIFMWIKEVFPLSYFR